MYKKSLTYIKYGADNGYDPEEGSFSLCVLKGKDSYQRSDRWYSCREEFDDVFPSRSRKLLFYDDRQGENIARFIEEVEKRLSVEPKSEILGFENVSNVSFVNFSKWWIANRARRQLFTILLRCGTAYRDDFDRALKSQDYILETQAAVDKFLKGYTHCTLHMSGWNGWVGNFSRSEFEDIWYDKHYEAEEGDERFEKAWSKQLDRLKKPINK